MAWHARPVPAAARETRDRVLLERLLRREPEWAAYGLGDLDEPIFGRTRWFVGDDDAALALLFQDATATCLITYGDAAGVGPLVRALPLPEAFAVHTPAAHAAALEPLLTGDLVPYLRMALRRPDLRAVPGPPGAAVVRLGPADVPAARALYAHYPDNWFDPARVEAGCYFGVREGGALAAVGGTHVASAAYRVAALGDIVTDPARRGRGLGALLTHALAAELLGRVELVVLNVKTSNAPARRAYGKVGFRDAVDHLEGWPIRRA